MTDLSKYEAAAHALGVEAAKAAASWATDGNTSTEHYAQMIRWQEDGDPRFYDYLPPMPNLSGEWADAPTPASLALDIMGPGPDDAAREFAVDAICEAWEAGVMETFEPECERLIRAAMPSCTCPDDCNCHHSWRTNFCGCQEH